MTTLVHVSMSPNNARMSPYTTSMSPNNTTSFTANSLRHTSRDVLQQRCFCEAPQNKIKYMNTKRHRPLMTQHRKNSTKVINKNNQTQTNPLAAFDVKK